MFKTYLMMIDFANKSLQLADFLAASEVSLAFVGSSWLKQLISHKDRGKKENKETVDRSSDLLGPLETKPVTTLTSNLVSK